MRVLIYDDHGLARLAFISRAKQLGCTLEEITDLLSIWDGERCGQVQARFHRLVTDKITEAARQINDLSALGAQLRHAAAQLAGPAADGPCGPGCACLRVEAPTNNLGVAVVAEPDEAPIACTLDPAAIGDRVQEWRTLVARATARMTAADGTARLEFGRDIDVAALAALAAAEQTCCRFFSFTLRIRTTASASKRALPPARQRWSKSYSP